MPEYFYKIYHKYQKDKFIKEKQAEKKAKQHQRLSQSLQRFTTFKRKDSQKSRMSSQASNMSPLKTHQTQSSDEISDSDSQTNEDLTQTSNRVIFCYAAMLPAGFHHFMIYCPKTQRLFIKDINVPTSSFNQIYPELPIQDTTEIKQKAPVQNVWREWIDDTNETEVLVYANDVSSELYQPQVIVRKKQDLDQINTFMKKHRYIFKVFYRELLARAAKYPKLKFEEIYKVLAICQNPEDAKTLPRSFCELSFLQSSKNQKVRGLKGELCRAELMDFIMRMVSQISPKNIFEGLKRFFDLYLVPIYEKSDIPSHRTIIRASQKLNKLLLLNKNFIEAIYKEARGNCSLKFCQDLICSDKTGREKEAINLTFINNNEEEQWNPNEGNPTYSPPEDPLMRLLPTDAVTRCFVYSQMTIQNEQKFSKKYHFLYYPEFLEFLCRIALYLFSEGSLADKTVQEKVLELLLILQIRRKINEDIDKIDDLKLVQKRTFENGQRMADQIYTPDFSSDEDQ